MTIVSKRIKSVKRIKKKAKVYNFHVPGTECYIANGFITHNCYVARNNTYGNPVNLYTNIEEVVDYTIKFLKDLKPKKPSQTHPSRWITDIGPNTDMLGRSNIEQTNYIIQRITKETECNTTFATKIGHPANVCKLKPVEPGRARVRMSLSPQCLADVLEEGTSKITDRLAGVETALDLGYEVHLNFSPVVIYKDWVKDYIELFKLVHNTLSQPAKKQLKCEVIFLTHSPKLHKDNLLWKPEAEELLWRPDLQEEKRCGVLRYQAKTTKKKAIKAFKQLLVNYLPYCPIRYIF